ncbi:MAG: flavin reductase family protein [Actinomycetota bacterium]
MIAPPDDLRTAASRFASGVTVVTTARDGELHGMTASSFASVSLEPPLVLISLDKSSRTRGIVLEVGTFAINILSGEQEEVARAFAVRGDKTFESVPHHLDKSGAPFLNGALASLSCSTVEVVAGGDHDVFIAEVIAVEARPGEPLLYFDRDYRRLSG